jgi:hypothetical protein
MQIFQELFIFFNWKNDGRSLAFIINHELFTSSFHRIYLHLVAFDVITIRLPVKSLGYKDMISPFLVIRISERNPRGAGHENGAEIASVCEFAARVGFPQQR